MSQTPQYLYSRPKDSQEPYPFLSKIRVQFDLLRVLENLHKPHGIILLGPTSVKMVCRVKEDASSATFPLYSWEGYCS